jgi:trans-2,3-dihydro-3-hydroxyanthranilate isomerase
MDHRFVITDVFSATPFGGNQLAVFPDAQGISSRAMQALAREFNFAETTFVLPPEDKRFAARVRIFTPKAELPFAGHPTVGTACVLAHLGRARGATLVLEEGIGPVAVEVKQEGSSLSARFALEQAIEHPKETLAVDHAAAALSLPKDLVVETWFAGLGVRFAFVRLVDEKAVDRAALDRGAWAKRFASAWASNLYLFAGDVTPGGKLYVRMFAPALGIDEDPATGSGAAVLAGCLAERAGRGGTHAWRIAQGIALGRPSTIEASAETHAGRVTKIWVGGATVIMAEGTMRVPEGY